MKTKAVRLYGTNDLRLETFELPDIQDDEVLAMVVSDTLCMSTYKLAQQGANHKRAPKDLENNPVMVGHEFSGVIVQAGKKYEDEYPKGMAFAFQPNFDFPDRFDAPGYSYPYMGGDATYIIFPAEAMALHTLFPYRGKGFFRSSLAEPVSCVIGAYRSCYHNDTKNHQHIMGVKENGRILIAGGCGPMGLAAIAYGLVCDKHPRQIVVTDIDPERLERARKVLPVQAAKEKGIELVYADACKEDWTDQCQAMTDHQGFDDVFVMVPREEVVTQCDSLLGKDGCLHLFAGPQDQKFSSLINAYNIHYLNTHFVGSSGGSKEDLLEALAHFESGALDPAVMVTHIGGLEAALTATVQLPDLPGGKKCIYPHIDLPLTAIDDFEALGKENALFERLHRSCQAHNGLWNEEAEEILLREYGVWPWE